MSSRPLGREALIVETMRLWSLTNLKTLDTFRQQKMGGTYESHFGWPKYCLHCEELNNQI